MRKRSSLFALQHDALRSARWTLRPLLRPGAKSVSLADYVAQFGRHQGSCGQRGWWPLSRPNDVTIPVPGLAAAATCAMCVWRRQTKYFWYDKSGNGVAGRTL